MKINNCYIISWFGRDPDLKERRQRMHQTQIDWCHKHSLHPVVFAQEYEDSDYLDGVTYIRNEGPLLHPGPARNVLLRHFYQTDDDYAVFADNDGILYEDAQHGDSARYIEIMRGLPIEDFASIDAINPVNPARMAFAKELATDIYHTHLVYRKTNKIKGTVFFMKNIRLHRDTEIYFDEELFNDNGRMLPGEDTEFACAILFAGLGCYYTYNAIVNELGTNYSTWTNTNEHSNIIPIYESINRKYGGDLFIIPEDTVRGYGYIGYSKNTRGKWTFRMARDLASRVKVLENHSDTDIRFYEIPVLPIADAVAYARANILDPVLQELLADQERKNKTFVNRGKNRVQFNWDLVPFVIPVLPDKVTVKK